MDYGSKIFHGFRSLGFVSNHVPIDVRFSSKHKENYVITCVGKCLQTYNCSKLGIVSISDSIPEQITCFTSDERRVFAAASNSIYCFKQGKKVYEVLEGHLKPVHLLLAFGSHLLSVDKGSCVKIWQILDNELYLELQFDNSSFEVMSLVHPSTYINKILFASRQGTMQLWNIHQNKLVYSFAGWDSPIAVLQQAPAIDIIAVGLLSGKIILHNIKYEETVMHFLQEWGPVTSISFRTDGQPIMLTGSTIGHIAIWNLQEKKLENQIHSAHDSSPVFGMRCLPSEPLMLTSSSDNSLKLWIFDQVNNGARLLNQRSGHSSPPNKVKFASSSGENILSTGKDSTFRLFNTVHDGNNKSFGRASYNKAESKRQGLKHDTHKMPAIVDFSYEPLRQSDWDSIAACHHGLAEVTTWNYTHSKMGAFKLKPTHLSQSHHQASSVCITSCGNFVLIGYNTGEAYVFNMQSGIIRGKYGKPAHTKAVRGVATDTLNLVVITAGADSTIKFWRFKQRTLLRVVELESPVCKINLHRESSLLAVACDDYSLTIFDAINQKIVRKLLYHSSFITDMAFRPDGRWLISSTTDGILRTWDLPTGRLIDCFQLENAVTSLDMSSTGEFLVTTHVDDVGVYLWSNMTLYSHVSLTPLPSNYEPQPISLLPNIHIDDKNQNLSDAYIESKFKSPDQISDELVTLSLLPNSRWQNLLNLDLIKQRNKPKQPPKIPKAAPFFLPTLPGLHPSFLIEEENNDDEKKSRILKHKIKSTSQFVKLLEQNENISNYENVTNFFKELGPSQIYQEIQSLSPLLSGSIDVMFYFMDYLEFMFNRKKDFELVQAYYGLFLQMHGETIKSDPKLTEKLKGLEKTQSECWKTIEDLFNHSLCLANYIQSSAL